VTEEEIEIVEGGQEPFVFITKLKTVFMQHIYLCVVALDSWEIMIGMLLAALGFIITYAEYKKSNRIKRAEFLEELIAEFNESKTYIARKLLDDFWFDGKLANPKEYSDEAFIKGGSGKAKGNLAADLAMVLRDHKGQDNEVIDEGEQRVRESFDELLEFFTKLEYYLSLKLISKPELYYFEYYINCCYHKANGGVRIFAAAYGYKPLFRLFFVMNTDKKDKDRYSQKPEFTSNAQELYYHDLRNDLNIL